MELVVSHASVAGAACQAVLADVMPNLSNLRRLLLGWHEAARDEGSAYSRSTTTERALARAVGLPDADGRIPWAAWQRALAGLPTGQHGREAAWAEVTPCHWHVGLDHIVMDNPANLVLDVQASQALLEVVHPLFVTEGITLEWADARRWWATGEVFDGLQTASVGRVAGRNIDAWMPEGEHQPRSASVLRRLQNEVQMLLHQHPVNEARAALGAPAVNSLWFSQCGRLPVGCVKTDLPAVPVGLGEAALAEDWVAYAQAWRELDATWLARPDLQAVTLCGESSSVRLEPVRGRPKGFVTRLWERLQPSPSDASLVQRLMALSAADDGGDGR